MSAGDYLVLLFRSTNHALRAEKVLDQEGIGSKLIPVPRQLSSDCGVCLRIARPDRDRARRVLEASGVQILRIHDI